MNKLEVNILTEDVAKAKLLFDCRFNVVSDRKDIIAGKPVIILGWEFTKQLIPEASILKNELDEGIYWAHFPWIDTKSFSAVVMKVMNYSNFLEVMNF